jgi:adenylosuccinate synthase
LADVAPLAVAVVDLGFGDAGKGLVTDYLTRRLAATAVVRFNGGAQAGHNVVTPDGRHHTFAQLGAGSFVEGVETWLGPAVVVHPTALLVESARLEGSGVPDPLARVRLHDDAPLVTPLHQALGRLRELSRGARRHGSCGVGIGEVALELRRGEPALRAAHLRDGALLAAALRSHLERKTEELRELRPALPDDPAVRQELRAFDRAALHRWLELATGVARRMRILDEAAWRSDLERHRRVVFEGAQGVLLDRDHGFFPYVSPGDCTLAGAEALVAALGRPLFRLGVLRAYSVRHGPGPLPGELEPRPVWAREAHNADGPWQGAVRVSFPDSVLSRHAVRAVGGVDALAVTHLDRVERAWGEIDAYDFPAATGVARVRNLPSLAAASLERRTAETERLLTAAAVTTPLRLRQHRPGFALAERLAQALDVRLGLVSTGPTFADVENVALPFL